FLASPTSPAHNPYGVMAADVPFPVGKLLDDHLDGPPLSPEAYRLGAAWAGAQLPRLADTPFSVVGTWNQKRGDHVFSQIEEPTGSGGGDLPGLLTRIDAGLGDGIPCMHLAPSARFGQAPGDLARFAPVDLADVHSLPDNTAADPGWLAATGNDWVRDEGMRLRFDDAAVDARRGFGRALADTFRAHHRAGSRLGSILSQPALHLDLEASLGNVVVGGNTLPLTNAMLTELFTRPLADASDPLLWNSALDLALAVRLLQI